MTLPADYGNALTEELTEMEGQIHAHFTKPLTLKNIKHTSFGSGGFWETVDYILNVKTALSII